MNELKFKTGDIKISISFWFMLFVSLASYLSEDFYIVIISVVIHELAHTLFLLLFGGKISAVNLKLTDINIKSNVMSLNPLKASIVLLAGSISNILLASVFYNLNKDMSFINLIIGVFQLLPIESSDLDNLIKIITKDKFNKSLKTIYLIFALAVFFLGIKLIMISKWNYTLLITSLALIIRSITN